MPMDRRAEPSFCMKGLLRCHVESSAVTPQRSRFWPGWGGMNSGRSVVVERSPLQRARFVNPNPRLRSAADTPVAGPLASSAITR